MITARWRRLDINGHDAALLRTRPDGTHELVGTALFHLAPTRAVAHLAYLLECAPDWRTRRGRVHGWIGTTAVDLTIVRDPSGAWRVNGAAVHGLDDCVDLDFGFTPATSVSQIARLGLAVGQAAEVPVAWLDIGPCTLARVAQRYERRDVDAYWYESPGFQVAALLRMAPTRDPSGACFVASYPGLWEAET